MASQGVFKGRLHHITVVNEVGKGGERWWGLVVEMKRVGKLLLKHRHSMWQLMK